MKSAAENEGWLKQVATSVRMVVVTMVSCCLLYPLAILGVGQSLVPYSANGSIVYNGQGEIVGSELIAQGFSQPEYFWPRPSAVDYNAAAAGGSNLSPASAELRQRAEELVTRFQAGGGNPIPADLVAASGSGLDPHITLAAAAYQAQRVASARGQQLETVLELLRTHALKPLGGFAAAPLVNVLVVNLALDGLGK